MDKKRIEVVCAVIKNNSNEVLIAERGYGEFKNMWEFPGGKLEPNETKEECICREIKEEMGVNLIIDSFISTIEYSYDSFDLTMHAFLCHIHPEEIKLYEHLNMKWCKLNDLEKEKLLPADILVVEEYLKINNKNFS